ncbi:secretin N-terminal domain-containing protein [Sulfurimonas sp.]|jgi:general secretion pathway protein D|uniref:secretin N-terminal domain-containing protein n=1 Tax=Sulfurimonas sp. TaxID=2022749 RepID=UPI0025CD2FA1|nr:secretin N-terminal domain-containing protein [Sulfurimonas sp.]MBT5935857.1 hypothetical protein [Sulfurimonas sp.]
MKFVKTLLLSTFLVFSLNAREQVNVNFSDLQIDDFIKLISKITHKNILINNKINGTVNFVSTVPVYDDELIGILISVLESKGFTLVKKGSIFEVVRSTEAAKNNVAVMTSGKKIYGSLMVTQAISVKGENVDIIAAKIRYLISKTAKLMTMKESNTILLTDYPKNIETIKHVIKEIDTNNQAIVKIIPIKNAEAKKLQTRLVDISKSIFNVKVLTEQVKIILDDNINGLIVIGLKDNVAKIQELVTTLDVESHASNGIQIFSLKNSDAKTVAATLNDIISKQTFTDPSMKPNIAASEEINAIIAIGEPIIIKGIKLIVDELDKEQYQVYVKARIIEINNNDSSDIGIKYGLALGDVTPSGLYAMSANFGSDALTSTASASVLDHLGGIGSGAGKSLALGATLDFLEANGASKSISNPSILCVNNKESSIYVGKTISVQTASTVGTTGLPTASYKREDIGLTLKIKPLVSSTDKVTLDVEAILENILVPDINGNPITSKQEVKTQAILGHGESIIIGGLVKIYDTKTVSKIPLLGDIPWIGEYLFSSTSVNEEKDNLVVILTPYVIDKSEELSKLQKELGVLAKIQAEYSQEAMDALEKKKEEENE